MGRSDVLIACECVADHHRIRALRIKRPIGLVSDLKWRELDAGIQLQRLVRPEAHHK
jgi:hypothetical protein